MWADLLVPVSILAQLCKGLRLELGVGFEAVALGWTQHQTCSEKGNKIKKKSFLHSQQGQIYGWAWVDGSTQ